MNKIKLLLLMVVLLFSFNITAFAEENDSISTETGAFEEIENWDGQKDQYVDGIYNTNPQARAALTGVIQLSQSGTKLVSQYSTSYSTNVSRIGVKNVRLMYKGSLGIWHTIVTLDDRYNTNDSLYAGAFSVTGTIGRTYMLSCTHYYKTSVSSGTKYNETEGLTFR